VLRGTTATDISVLIGCRTSDVPSTLVDALKASFGQCHVADLAPLTYRQALSLVVGNPGVDGEVLLAKAANAGAGVLASVPLTLRFLLDEFIQSGDIVGGVAELFARGTVRLLDEPAASRRIDLETSPQQRQAIVGRIAALLLLSGRRTAWIGEALGGGPQDLDLSEAVGGFEYATDQPFDVTQRSVNEARATAIFTGRGDNRLAFRHGSIAAYLNASLLVSSAVPVDQLRSLFFVPVGTGR
jgi:hypothetical protein